jgi:phenylacetate-CoA ligase
MEIQGYPIKKCQRDLASIKTLSNSEFKTYINNHIWSQLNYFRTNNIFYRNFIGKKVIDKWEDVPIIKKSDLQRPLSSILTNGIISKDIFKNKTSGSSGTPFYFAKDKEAHARTWALVLDRYARHNIIYGKSLQARFYGIPLHGISYYKEKIKDIISNRIRFPIFDLSDQILDRFIIKFKQRKFEYINGYTSCLVYFAQYLIRKNIVLKDYCPTLKICFPTSEMCRQSDRIILEKGFGVSVANENGCAEMDILAFEDENFDWIVSNENVFFEIVDESGKNVERGNSGRVIITSLYNKAVPLIRYELGDIGALDSKVKGQNDVLLDLLGRTNEFAELPSGRKVPALTFYYITKTLIKEKYSIKEFVIKQISISEFLFEYVSDNELPSSAKIQINKAMDEYLEPNLKSIFEKRNKIERSSAGKLKQFENLL